MPLRTTLVGLHWIWITMAGMRMCLLHPVSNGWPIGTPTMASQLPIGVLHENSLASTFFGGTGDYGGGTDAIGDVTIKGVVPIAPGTGELGLLIKAASLDGTQTLIRYRSGLVQRIETIEFNCN